MTPDDLLEVLTFGRVIIKDEVVNQLSALREIVKYAKDLADTDYRGNPPTEHYISRKICKIIEKELSK